MRTERLTIGRLKLRPARQHFLAGRFQPRSMRYQSSGSRRSPQTIARLRRPFSELLEPRSAISGFCPTDKFGHGHFSLFALETSDHGNDTSIGSGDVSRAGHQGGRLAVHGLPRHLAALHDPRLQAR